MGLFTVREAGMLFLASMVAEETLAVVAETKSDWKKGPPGMPTVTTVGLYSVSMVPLSE